MSRLERALIGCGMVLALWVGQAIGGVPEPVQAWRQVPAAFHVHSVLSTGSDSFESLADQAGESGIEAIFLTDNYLLRYEYGLFPLSGLIRRTYELPSVVQLGVGRFLSEVREAGLRHPKVLFIPGVEVVPHYYWTGSLAGKDLTMHDSQKNILVLGLPTEEDYARLPSAGNHAAYEYGWNTVVLLWPILLVPPAIRLITRRVERRMGTGWTLMVVHERRPTPGVALLTVSVFLLVNNYPFGTPPYDIYSDGNGLRPHQGVIDYVRQRGGISIWSMPEARDFNRYDYGRLGVVTVKTDPYPEVLSQTSGYTGFGAVYQDNVTATNPGGVWDTVLTEYVENPRPGAVPPWGVGEAAYRGPDSGGKHLHQITTVLLVKEPTPAALLEAMAAGRMYARFRSKEYGLVLNDFTLESVVTGATAISGQVVQAPPSTPIQIRVAVATTDGRPHQTSVKVIRSGQVVASSTESVPFSLTVQGVAPSAGRTAYYRLVIGSGEQSVITNPIFVRASTSSARTAGGHVSSSPRREGGGEGGSQ